MRIRILLLLYVVSNISSIQCLFQKCFSTPDVHNNIVHVDAQNWTPCHLYKIIEMVSEGYRIFENKLIIKPKLASI